MPTPHISANENEIAKLVLMPGDPLRAKEFAKKYLKDPKLVNEVRGMLAYTGTYNGKRVTVMGHGMGMSSIGIYAYELYKFYNVETIIRFGSCGSYTDELNLFDLIIGEKSFEDSNFGSGFGIDGNITNATPSLVKLAEKVTSDLKFKRNVVKTTVHSSQWFYKETNKNNLDDFVKRDIKVVEMEASALYAIAQNLNKQALVLLTVSDNLVTKKGTTSQERQTGFTDMFETLLGIIDQI